MAKRAARNVQPDASANRSKSPGNAAKSAPEAATRRRRVKSDTSQSDTAEQREPCPLAPLTILVYLCGDNHIQAETVEYFERMARALPAKHFHLVIQHDVPGRTQRFIAQVGESEPKCRHQFNRGSNSGDPKSLAEFLKWGIAEAPAERHVVILSGLGVNPRYVRNSLPTECLPKPLRPVRDDHLWKPASDAFAETFQQLATNDPESVRNYRQAVHQRLFSLCHDYSHSGSLGISDLRQVLIEALEQLEPIKADPRLELIVFDAGATAFVEVLFELEGLAKYYVGSQSMIPDIGLPYQTIFRAWDEAIAAPRSKKRSRSECDTLGAALAASICEITDKAFSKPVKKANPITASPCMVAVNLEALEEVARCLDAVAIALMHSIGDWDVLDACKKATDPSQLGLVSAAETGVQARLKSVGTALEDVEFLPAVDLFELLELLEDAFASKIKPGRRAGTPPPSLRLRKLHRLLRKMITHLHSPALIRGVGACGSLMLPIRGREIRPRGLSILLPPTRSAAEIDAGVGKLFSLSNPSYTNLNFSKRVHWSALIGAIQMIRERPHALWRVISSMLADASSAARDAALGRLISKQSVIQDMQDQFQSLGESESLTLSIEPVEAFRGARREGADSDLERFLVRLEPSLGGAVIYQQESRIYRSTLDATLHDLHALLHSSDRMGHIVSSIRALGTTLGEDVIQDLVKAIEAERGAIVAERSETPHLTLQLPRELMRYPWELMFDRQSTLGERFALGRQVFVESRFVQQVPRRVNDVIRILVVGDPTYDDAFLGKMASRNMPIRRLPHARLEAETIVRAFEQLNDEMAGVIELNVKALIDKRVSVNDMRSFFRDGAFDLIHFAGHSYYSKSDPDGSAWVLSDGLLRAREIKNVLSWSNFRPWLIFANACEAGMDGAPDGEQVGDVTGLATACINQGVASYIAPLWPVNDEEARKLACRFYRELLRERYSVGESLRRAKVSIWEDLQWSGDAQNLPAKVALTWSSFVLYGDPTAKLLQSMWTPDRPVTSPKRVKPNLPPEIRFNATSRQLRSTQSRNHAVIHGLPASMVPAVEAVGAIAVPDQPAEMRGGDGNAAVAGPLSIALLERGGIRFWRTTDRAAKSERRYASPIGQFLSTFDEKRDAEQVNAFKEAIGHGDDSSLEPREIQSWSLERATGSESRRTPTELVADFDRQQVCREGLSRVFSAKVSKPLAMTTSHRAPDELDWLNCQLFAGQAQRVLLVVHGLLSSAQPIIDDLSIRLGDDETPDSGEYESPLDWMLRHYRAVLRFDHWTLSKSTQENAELLASQLDELWSTDKRRPPIEIDVICHGRGAQVIHQLLVNHRPAMKIRRVIFVGPTFSRTYLADPKRWPLMADVFANLLAEDHSGLYGKLSFFLTFALAQGLGSHVPGLHVPTEPTSRSDAGILQVPPPEYCVVAANYLPDPRWQSSLPVLEKAGLLKGYFDGHDQGTAGIHELLFDSTSAAPAAAHRPPPKQLRDSLLFNDQRHGQAQWRRVIKAGVHHTNYFVQLEVRDFIRDHLTATDDES